MSDKLRLILESAGAMEVFLDHCRSNAFEEMCGLFVIRAGEVLFVQCDNHAYDRKNSFLVHPADFVRCADVGDVIGVGHSHVVTSADPSDEDKINSENCMLPFVIFRPETGDVRSYDPSGGEISLIGRNWVLGVSDCYSVARDYYKTQGLELRDYVRNDLACLSTHSMFLEYFEENDFVAVSGPPKVNDAILIQVMANVPNHIAVMVADDIILHHLQNRLSCHEPYGGYWRRHTAKILRHKTWL